MDARLLDGSTPMLFPLLGTLLFALLIEIRFAFQQTDSTPSGASHDHLTGVLTVALALIIFGAPAVSKRFEIPHPVALGVFGLVIACIGIGIRAWSVVELGPLFSTRLEADSTHALVETGPYSLVRHPGYLGAIAMFLGFGLAMADLTSLAAAALFLPTVLRRIAREERVLRAAYGSRYFAFQRRVPMLLPRVRRLRTSLTHPQP